MRAHVRQPYDRPAGVARVRLHHLSKQVVGLLGNGWPVQ